MCCQDVAVSYENATKRISRSCNHHCPSCNHHQPAVVSLIDLSLIHGPGSTYKATPFVFDAATLLSHGQSYLLNDGQGSASPLSFSGAPSTPAEN
jgi:hypothetical protein